MMVNENEIRVGNWFDCSFVGRVQINKEDIGSWPGCAANAIYLTPEILLACGFDNKHGEGDCSWLHKDLMQNRNKYEIELLNIDDSGFALFRKGMLIKHLHQLQNLYFALTGTELIYKP